MTLTSDRPDNLAAAEADIPNAARLLVDPPGLALKKARQALRLELDVVANRLNLSPSVVVAIENDAYDRLPSPTFIRGYIRSYARLLKLSGDDLIRSYERLQPEKISETENGIKDSSFTVKKGWVFLFVLIVGVVLVISLVLIMGESADVTVDVDAVEIHHAEISEAGVAPVIAESIPVEAAVVADVDQVAEESVADEPLEADVPVLLAQPILTLSDTRVVDDASAIDATIQNIKNSQLTMQFSAECWVEVWDASGKRIYARLRQAGQTTVLEGVAPLEVTLGNGAAVKMEFNGNPVVFALSTRSSVAHVTLNAEAE